MSSVAPTNPVQHDTSTPMTDSAYVQLAVDRLMEDANPGATPSKLSKQKQQVLGSNGISLTTPARFDPSSGKFKEIVPLGVDPRLQSLYAEAKSRAPRCGRAPLDDPLQWMSVAQAASTFGMDKRIVSKLASQGAIASVKGFGNNAHRLIHFDNMFAWLQDSILRGDCETHKQPGAAAAAGSKSDSDLVAH